MNGSPPPTEPNQIAEVIAQAFEGAGFLEAAEAVRASKPPGWMSVEITREAIRLAVGLVVTRYERAVLGLAPLSVIEETSGGLRAEFGEAASKAREARS